MISKKTYSDMDWKKIAQKRLVDLGILRRQCDLLRNRMADDIEKELAKLFHSSCLPKSEYEHALKYIAEAVADRLKPEVP